MLVHIKNVLTADQVARCLEALARAPWIDGRRSAGPTAAQAKQNMEADLTDPTVRGWSDGLQKILKANPAFMAGALPARICPPSFNRYEQGQTYGVHNDAALFDFSGIGQGWIRGDLAATLFLSAPGDYDGGELMIGDTFGPSKVKLPAGDMVLYPASSQHQVAPVTRGARVAAYFWIQSLVRDETQRRLLHDLDGSIMQLNQVAPGHQATLQLLGLYHNLLRMWSDT
jgi:PKHD-type hydroxylase